MIKFQCPASFLTTKRLVQNTFQICESKFLVHFPLFFSFKKFPTLLFRNEMELSRFLLCMLTLTANLCSFSEDEWNLFLFNEFAQHRLFYIYIEISFFCVWLRSIVTLEMSGTIYYYFYTHVPRYPVYLILKGTALNIYYENKLWTWLFLLTKNVIRIS